MPAITKTAPGKVILFGEHAVVYGRPAIAVPVSQVRARAVVSANPLSAPGDVHIHAPDVGLESRLDDMPADHPLLQAVNGVLEELSVVRPPSCTIRITSTIPIAAGMGSGAAISVAIIRAFSTFLGKTLPDERVSSLAYEVEKLHHGTPSGIDNTVVTYAMPVYFTRRDPSSDGQRIDVLPVPVPFTLVIGDTGVSSPTALAVGEVRRAWEQSPQYLEGLFDVVGRISQDARKAIEKGQPDTLGSLMDENHTILQEMRVSSPELDRLVEIARTSGALGAKLSGAGKGGNMIALSREAAAPVVTQALLSSGAARVILTRVCSSGIS